MFKKFVGLVFIAICLVASGCASFKANNIPEVSDSEFKMVTNEKVKVFTRWKFETTSSIINKDAAAAIHKSAFEKVVNQSGCCDLVEGPTEANLIIDGTVVDHSSSAALIPAFITGLSLYTIPSWVTQTLDVTVKAEAGELQKNYQLNDSFTLVQWLPMLFAFPFTGGPVQNGEDLNENTYKHLIVQLKNDNML
tara:strand:+ start:11271 stop:11852 length:582 start_codon:yes stop_codon:yes gene_type:complete